MKKTILLSIIMLSLFMQTLKAQNNAIELTGGFLPNNYGAVGSGAEISYIISNNDNYYKIGFAYSQNTTNIKTPNINIPYNTFSLNANYMFALFINNKQSIKISAGPGIVAAYELINNNEQLEESTLIKITSESKIIYGGLINLETEIAISRDLYFIQNNNIYYHVNSDLGNLSLFSSIGLKYYL